MNKNKSADNDKCIIVIKNQSIYYFSNRENKTSIVIQVVSRLCTAFFYIILKKYNKNYQRIVQYVVTYGLKKL